MTKETWVNLKEEGNALFRLKQFSNAIEKYKSALEFCDDDVEQSVLFANLALCDIQNENWNSAIKWASEAIERNPENPKGFYRRAIAKEKIGSINEAFKDVTSAVKLSCYDKDASFLQNRLRCLIMSGKEAQLNKNYPPAANSQLKCALNRIKLTLTRYNSTVAFSPESSDLSFDSIDTENCLNSLKAIYSWVLHRPSTLQKSAEIAEAIANIGGFVKAMADANLDTVKKARLCAPLLEVQARALKLFWLMMTHKAEEEDAHEIQRRRMLSLDAPVQLSVEKQEICRLLQEHVPMPVLLAILKALLHLNVSDKDEDWTSYGKPCTIHIIDLMAQIGSLDDTVCLEAIETAALKSSESPALGKAALRALGRLADIRRRKGLRVLALKKTHALMRLLETVVAMLGLSEKKIVTYAEFALTSVFVLFADKERAPEDALSLSETGTAIFEPYLGEDTDDLSIGLKGLQLLWLADREAVRDIIISKSLMTTLLRLACASSRPYSEGLKEGAMDLLMHSMEFPELREEVLAAGVVNQLTGCCSGLDAPKKEISGSQLATSLKLGVCLARLCAHGEDVRQRVFDKFDFLQVALSTLSLFRSQHDEPRDLTNSKSTHGAMPSHSGEAKLYLELLLFLTLHGSFKQRLVDTHCFNNIIEELPNLGAMVGNAADSLGCYFFVSVVCNLIRCREDKEITRQNKPGGPQLEESEREALRHFFENLPEHTRPAPTGKFDRGDERIAKEFERRLLELNCVKVLSDICLLKPLTSLTLLSLIVETLWLFIRKETNRGLVIKDGGIRALLFACNIFQENGQAYYASDLQRGRQALAQLCISFNPKLLSYKETLDMVPHFLKLLQDNYELLQYEATLALTNLISYSDEARIRVFHGGGISALMDVATSDNDLCRAAGVEAICNMAMCAEFREKIASNGCKVDMQLLFAFLGEKENLRAQTAAAGAIAMLTSDEAVTLSLARNVPNISNLTKALLEFDFNKEQQDFLLRIVTAANNIILISNAQVVRPESPLPSLQKWAQDLSAAISKIEAQLVSENSDTAKSILSILKS